MRVLTERYCYAPERRILEAVEPLPGIASVLEIRTYRIRGTSSLPTEHGDGLRREAWITSAN